MAQGFELPPLNTGIIYIRCSDKNDIGFTLTKNIVAVSLMHVM